MNELHSEKTPNFDGKVVAFYCGANPHFATAIQSPVFQTQLGRLFVVGASAPRTPTRWDDNLQTAIAWDTVSTYNVFDSLADYDDRMSQPEYTQPRTTTGWLSRLWRQ